MEIKGKKVLILGGPSQCVSVVTAAKEMGLYTIVADKNLNAPAAKIADEVAELSVLDEYKSVKAKKAKQ